MSTLHVDIVAADRKVWEGEATMVTARTVEGDLGILPEHTPVLAVLADEGEVSVHTVDAGRRAINVSGGFLSVDQNRVTDVADTVDAASLSH